MKTREQVLKAVRDGKKSTCLDGRDFSRLVDFFPVTDWEAFGYRPQEGTDTSQIIIQDLTEENVKAQLASDLAFGFEKALNKRGISASSMYEVVKMWMWVLDDELVLFDDYAQYGLPLFKAVAIKYGLPNPIEDDDGSEDKYSD